MNTQPATNSDKFNFSDFTTESYRGLLKSAKLNYSFTNYEDFRQKQRFILWRHDLDFSLNRAYRLSEIEKEEGVKATYFVLMRGQFYNIFEKRNFELLKGIVSNGHHIGLHFDAEFYDLGTEEAIEKPLQREKQILEAELGVQVSAFSFHNPSQDVLDRFREFQYSGLVNTYAQHFRDNVGYCSDSNGYWRFRRLHDVLERAEDTNLQVLTHPEWWQEEVMSPKEKIWKCIDGRANYCKKFYTDLIESIGYKNVDWHD